MFEINGYWKEDKEPIEGYIVLSQEYEEEIMGEDDESIFYYGLNEEDLKEAVTLGEAFQEDFVITSYSKLI